MKPRPSSNSRNFNAAFSTQQTQNGHATIVAKTQQKSSSSPPKVRNTSWASVVQVQDFTFSFLNMQYKMSLIRGIKGYFVKFWIQTNMNDKSENSENKIIL